MKRFRALIFWCHLATGFLAGLVVLIMSVTGVLLTYQKQITRWADMRAFRTEAPSPGAAHLPLEKLMAQVRAREPKPPTAVTWYADPAAPVMVAFGRERTVFVNRYTGATLGDGSGGVRTFFRVVTDWHRWLGASGESREMGKAITGAANLGFLFLVVSGFYLWWPRNWNRRALRNVTWFRGGLPAKAREFNWHNVIGFWSVAPLFLIVLSGVVISYSWAGDLVYRVVGEAPPAPSGGGGGAPAGGGAAGAGATAAREGARPGGGEPGRPAGESGGRPGGEGRGEGGGRAEPVSLAGLDRAAALAARQVEGWRSISLQMPKEADAPLALTVDKGLGGQPQKRGQLKVDRVSGEVVSWEPFSSNTPGRQLRMFLRFAHTGEVGGIIGQTIAGLVSLGAVVLVWTGIALSLRRFGAWRGRRGPDVAARRQRGRGAEQTAGV